MDKLVSVGKFPIFGVILALLVLAILLFATQFSSTAAADEGNLKHFIGLWMAVDPSDGGFINLSITDNDRDKVAELNLNETFVSTCLGGRALINGSGSLDDEGDLQAQLTIQCLEDTTNDPKGDPVGPIPVVFQAIGTNIIEFTVPVIPNFLPVSLHRLTPTQETDLSDYSLSELFRMEEAGDITTDELVAELERRKQTNS